MRRRLGHVAMTAALLTAVGGLAVTQATADITAPETFVLIGHDVKFAEVNLGDKAYGPGDSFMFVTQLFDETDQTRVGTYHGQCTIQPGKGWALCSVAVFIKGRGQIMVEGGVQFTPNTTPFDVPITGGTGDFADVRGYIHVEPIDDTSERDTLFLLP